ETSSNSSGICLISCVDRDHRKTLVSHHAVGRSGAGCWILPNLATRTQSAALAMFRGQFQHSVDAKGRISLPSRFRDAIVSGGDARFVLTPALFDPCLHLYPMRAWEEFEAKVAELPSMDPHIVRFRRLYVSAAIECDLDSASRVLVPPHLR